MAYDIFAIFWSFFSNGIAMLKMIFWHVICRDWPCDLCELRGVSIMIIAEYIQHSALSLKLQILADNEFGATRNVLINITNHVAHPMIDSWWRVWISRAQHQKQSITLNTDITSQTIVHYVFIKFYVIFSSSHLNRLNITPTCIRITNYFQNVTCQNKLKHSRK